MIYSIIRTKAAYYTFYRCYCQFIAIFHELRTVYNQFDNPILNPLCTIGVRVLTYLYWYERTGGSRCIIASYTRIIVKEKGKILQSLNCNLNEKFSTTQQFNHNQTKAMLMEYFSNDVIMMKHNQYFDDV